MKKEIVDSFNQAKALMAQADEARQHCDNVVACERFKAALARLDAAECANYSSRNAQDKLSEGFDALMVRVVERFLDDQDISRLRAECLDGLAEILLQLGEHSEAEALYRKALLAHEIADGQDDLASARSLDGLATVARALGQKQLARDYFERALMIRRRSLGNAHPDLLQSLDALAELCESIDDDDRARIYCEQALVIRRWTLGETHPHVASSLDRLGRLSRRLEDDSTAKACFEQALAIRRETLGPAHSSLPLILDELGSLAECAGDFTAARDSYRESLAIRSRTHGADSRLAALSLADLGMISLLIGERSTAKEYLTKAIDIFALGEFYPGMVRPLRGLADIALAEGALPDAAGYLCEAMPIAPSVDGGAQLAEVYLGFCRLKRAERRRDAAIFFGKRAVNAMQAFRGRLKEIDPRLRSSVLAAEQAAFRELIVLLTESDRLGETQQVLAMLKEGELFNLLGRDPASDPRSSFAAFTGLEAEWARQGDALADDVAQLAREINALRSRSELGTEAERRSHEAREEHRATQHAFRAWLDGLLPDENRL